MDVNYNDDGSGLSCDECGEIIVEETAPETAAEAKRRGMQYDDEKALDEIAEVLDAIEWTPDTLDAIAEIVRATYREVNDPNLPIDYKPAADVIEQIENRYPASDFGQDAAIGDALGWADDVADVANARCAVCGKPFTIDEWNDRHSPKADPEQDVHAACCPDCR
jgi:hypothetical protein